MTMLVRATWIAIMLAACGGSDDDGPRLVLTDLGFATLEELPPLHERERQARSARADRALRCA